MTIVYRKQIMGMQSRTKPLFKKGFWHRHGNEGKVDGIPSKTIPFASPELEPS